MKVYWKFRDQVALSRLFLFALMAGIFGCVGAPLNENDPVSLYDHAVDNIASSRYQMALDQLTMIKNKFPYSQVAIDAQLQMAEVYFRQEQYIEAAASFEVFFDLYPKHGRAAYALIRVAECYDKSTPSHPERDLTNATKAIKSYKNFLVHFKNEPLQTEQIALAKQRIQGLEEKLAQKEFAIGDFYYRREWFISARHRFEQIVKQYANTQTAKLAQEKLALIPAPLDQDAGKVSP
jgi:outer membrane protein assembly factor BamD